MKTLKAAAATAAVLGATALAGAAAAWPVVVPAPYGPAPYVYAHGPRVVVAPPPYYYAHPVWYGGAYYGYPYYWHGVRYFGPRGFHGRWR
jgi:hypothetical protein